MASQLRVPVAGVQARVAKLVADNKDLKKAQRHQATVSNQQELVTVKISEHLELHLINDTSSAHDDVALARETATRMAKSTPMATHLALNDNHVVAWYALRLARDLQLRYPQSNG